MNETERQALSEMLTQYGIAGVAVELASICRERSKGSESAAEGVTGLWQEYAQRFDELAK